MFCLGVIRLTAACDYYDPENGFEWLIAAEEYGHKEAALYNIILDVYRTADIEQLRDIAFVAHTYSKDDLGKMVYGLGLSMEDSPGVPNKEAFAFKLYCHSAKWGNIDGMKKAGHMLEYGNGTKTSWTDAMHYYQMAADLGDPEAKGMAEKLKDDMEHGYMIID